MTTGQGNWLKISPDWSLLASLCPWSARQEPILLNSSVLFPFTFSRAHISKQHRVRFCRILLLWSSSLGSNGRLWSPTTGVIWICILPFGHLPPITLHEYLYTYAQIAEWKFAHKWKFMPRSSKSSVNSSTLSIPVKPPTLMMLTTMYLSSDCFGPPRVHSTPPSPTQTADQGTPNVRWVANTNIIIITIVINMTSTDTLTKPLQSPLQDSCSTVEEEVCSQVSGIS